MPQIKINGVEHSIAVESRMPLLWAIRDIVGLTGTKFGCGVGACAAWTVHMDDDQAVRCCLTSLADAQGHEVVTIEGLCADGTHPVQRAWETQICFVENDHPPGGVGEPGVRRPRRQSARRSTAQPVWHPRVQ